MIEAKKIANDLYAVSGTPPDVDEAWSTVEPLSGNRIVEEWRAHGGHPVDVIDALDAADSHWEKE